MADVFISYSKADIEIAKALADDLTAHGFDVWWDHQLYAGDDFHDMILAEIAKAKATIVIWSATAAASRWVRGEADEAAHLNRLVSTSVPDFEPRGLPLNFRSFHCEPILNRDRIIAAIERKGAAANVPAVSSDEADAAPVLPAAERRPSDPETAEELYILGRKFDVGTAKGRDPSEAARLYSLAADMGNAPAQCSLSRFYGSGDGVEKNLQEAVRLLKLSAAQNNRLALYWLGQHYEEGRGVPKDESEASRYYTLAIKKGWNLAGFELGKMYEEGRGVRKDLEKASHFYRIAADEGSGQAKRALKRLGR